jgi:hypothetical protein
VEGDMNYDVCVVEMWNIKKIYFSILQGFDYVQGNKMKPRRTQALKYTLETSRTKTEGDPTSYEEIFLVTDNAVKRTNAVN